MENDLSQTIPPQRESDVIPGNDVTMPGKRDRKPDGRFERGDVILERYRVLSELGQGGMGVVYKCFDETAGIEIALKALPPELSHNTLEMEDIKDNFQLVAKLVHQNIAISKTLEKDNANGNYYLIMECVDGEDLRRWIKRKRKDGTLDLDAVIPVVRQVAEALDYAHGEKVMHRDIKPGNIMINAEGKVKVLDFGLAAQIHTSMTRVSMAYHGTSGTGPYMAPEQWRGRAQGAPADQYALAVMTYEMLAGHLPFESTDAAVLREAVLKDVPEPLKDVPPCVGAAITRAMSKEPEARFVCCRDFVDALGGRKVAARKARGGESSGRLKALVAASLVGVLLVGGGVLAYQRHAEKQAAILAEQKRLEQERKAAEEKRIAEEERLAEEKAREIVEAKAKAERAQKELEEAIRTAKEAEAKHKAEMAAKAEKERIAQEEAVRKAQEEKERQRQAAAQRKAEEARKAADEKQRQEARIKEEREKICGIWESDINIKGKTFVSGKEVQVPMFSEYRNLKLFGNGDFKYIQKFSNTQRETVFHGSWSFVNDILKLNGIDGNGRKTKMTFEVQWQSDSSFILRHDTYELAGTIKTTSGANIKTVNCSYNKLGELTIEMTLQGGVKTVTTFGKCVMTKAKVEEQKQNRGTKSEPMAEEEVLVEKPRQKELLKKENQMIGGPGGLFEAGERAFAEKNMVKAEELYRKAAQQGHSKACSKLSILYLNRDSDFYSEKKGIEMLKRAAEAGIPSAQYNLGCCYANFRGTRYASVPYDKQKAIEWLRKAKANGVVLAERQLKRLENR